ncbi:hypothetical protein MSMEI_5987 [Mycolicibacterium smegmatis MC2 155]|uniref:Uncharacterized protein n=1 Tax=Mycolicibacterium smegmatis (strain ATCC 700084 / mc(2)155) TaxID=246196 RepID=I7FMB2_MYCS2|nr:hypothetical protein MSMEI_5987 [Mycolicibacterium smegmatis MC2 155]
MVELGPVGRHTLSEGLARLVPRRVEPVKRSHGNPLAKPVNP